MPSCKSHTAPDINQTPRYHVPTLPSAMLDIRSKSVKTTDGKDDAEHCANNQSIVRYLACRSIAWIEHYGIESDWIEVTFDWPKRRDARHFIGCCDMIW
jgi:hypothetical protein